MHTLIYPLAVSLVAAVLLGRGGGGGGASVVLAAAALLWAVLAYACSLLVKAFRDGALVPPRNVFS